jgi:hypothetical protein
MQSLLLAPTAQALTVSALMVVALLWFRHRDAPRAGWNTTALPLLLFCVWNAVAGIWAIRIWGYLAASIGLFALLYPVTLWLAARLSGMSLDEFGPDAMVFLAPLLYYPGLLLVMGLLRLLTR